MQYTIRPSTSTNGGFWIYRRYNEATPFTKTYYHPSLDAAENHIKELKDERIDKIY